MIYNNVICDILIMYKWREYCHLLFLGFGWKFFISQKITSALAPPLWLLNGQNSYFHGTFT